MKKSKKFVLAGLVLVAITMVLLPLAGCKTEVDTSSPQQPGGKVIEYSGGTFTGLQEEVNALESGAILKLTADLTGVTESISIPAGKDFTLDLKGHTISGTANRILKVQESAKLTIIDSSSEKKGAITATGEDGDGVDNYGILEVSGGSITATGEDGDGVDNYGTLEVSGGSITATGEDGDGVVNHGTLEVSGGSITATGEYGYGVNNDGTLKVSGGSITGNDVGVYNRSREGVAFYLSGSPTITGRLELGNPVTLVGALTGSGTYTVDTGLLGGYVVAVGGSASTGGAVYHITESDKDKFTVDSNALKLEGNKNKIIWEGVGQPQRAFQDKVDAMAAGGTLSLDADLTDVTKRILIPAGKDFTLDLKGHTISGTAHAILEVQESAKLTIIDSSSEKKGAITGEGSSGVYNSGTLEVSGGSITGTSEYGWGVSNFGTLEVSGGSITGEGGSGVSNYGTLEVSGGSITGGSYGVNNDGTLKVSGGSITGNDAGVNNRSREGVAFYLSGSPTITGGLVLETPVTLVGALTGSGTYTVDTGSLTDTVIAQGGSATGGTAYQITESDKDKFTVATGTVTLEGNKIVWTEQATQ